MKIIGLEKGNEDECATCAAEVLRAGGVIIYPTDTLYALGADALSDKAVGKVYALKGRDEKKPVHCVVSDLGMAERYAEVDTFARMLAKEFLPGALALILKKKRGINAGIARGIGTIGIRIPDNQFCITLARAFDAPITTTSANKAGMRTERSVRRILNQLGRGAGIDLAVDAGELPLRKASTLVDMTGKEPVVVREGAISPAEIWDVLRSEY